MSYRDKETFYTNVKMNFSNTYEWHYIEHSHVAYIYMILII